jgi:hypothetical protein
MPRFFTTKLSQTDPDVLVSRGRLQAAATISSAILHARSAGSVTPSMFALNLFSGGSFSRLLKPLIATDPASQ